MKKQILTIALGLITVVSFGQKKELKDAEKALKKQDYATVLESLNSISSSIDNADEKLKSKYYFIQGQAFAGQKKYKLAAETFNKLFDFEKKTKKRYTDDAQPILNQMIQEVSQKAADIYNEGKDYKQASEGFYTTYLLSPKDTSFLYNAAVSASQASEFDASLKYYEELKKIGYTGIATEYLATNKKTGTQENLGSKSQRDLMVKTGEYIDPVDQKSESKLPSIVKNMAYILSQQGKYDEAVSAIQEARENDPNDINLLLTEADFYIKLNKMDEFGRLMKEAIKKDPSNPNLYYNLGVVNFNENRVEEAKEYYKKAIELKPDYADAYLNLAVAILAEDKNIVDEMNQNLSNFKKYDELEKKQKEVYKQALPYLEKGDQLKRSSETVRTLLNIYDILSMDEKSKEFRALKKSMEEQ